MAAPARERLRDARLAISVLVEQVGNGELANAKASSTALKAVIDAIDVI